MKSGVAHLQVNDQRRPFVTLPRPLIPLAAQPVSIRGPPWRSPTVSSHRRRLPTAGHHITGSRRRTGNSVTRRCRSDQKQPKQRPQHTETSRLPSPECLPNLYSPHDRRPPRLSGARAHRGRNAARLHRGAQHRARRRRDTRRRTAAHHRRRRHRENAHARLPRRSPHRTRRPARAHSAPHLHAPRRPRDAESRRATGRLGVGARAGRNVSRHRTPAAPALRPRGRARLATSPSWTRATPRI